MKKQWICLLLCILLCLCACGEVPSPTVIPTLSIGGTRIDYCFLSAQGFFVADCIADQNATGSDHYPLFAKLYPIP